MPEEKLKMRYDQELVLRFLAIKNDIASYKYPVTEYLTEHLEKMAKNEVNINYEHERDIFSRTFKFINENFGCDAFSGRSTRDVIKNELVLYYFDAITIPLASIIDLANDL